MDAATENSSDCHEETVDLRNKVVRSVGWNMMGAVVYQTLRILRALVLARLLVSEDYGLTGVARSALAIVSVMTGFGFGAALIQLKAKDIRLFADTSFSTMLVVLLLVVACAIPAIPWLANFYDDSRLIPILYCVFVSIVIRVLTSIPRSLVQRKLLYRDINIVMSISTLIVVVVSITMALAGYGYWSLIVPEMIVSLLVFAGTCWIADWFPRPRFSLTALRKIFSFTFTLSLYRILEFCYKAGADLLFGKFLGLSTFGYISFARNQSSFPLGVAVSQFYGVTYAALSRLQDNRKRLISRYMEMSSLLIFVFGPIFAMACALADPLVPFVFGDQWTPAIFPFQVFVIIALIQLLDTASLILAQCIGRPQFVLWVNLFKTPLLLGGLFVMGVYWKSGMNNMLIYIAGVQTVGVIVLAAILWTHLRVNLTLIWNGYGKGLSLTLALGILLWWLRAILADYCGLPDLAILSISLAVGGAGYLAASWLFNAEALYAFLDFGKRLLSRKRGLSTAD